MRKKINYIIGKLSARFGYRLMPSYKVPQCTLGILEFGINYLNTKRSSLTIIQIGAFDGEILDPLVGAIKDDNNQILLVEPQPGPYKSLVKRYSEYSNVTVENSAITEKDGEIDMYLPANMESSPKASIDEGHLKSFALDESDIKKISVNALSVKSLLDNHGLSGVDVLQIDTEGQDFNILCQFLDSGVRPSIINLEILHLSKKDRLSLRGRLDDLGYQYVEYGWDIFALKTD